MVLQNSMSQAFKDSNCEVEAMFIFSDLLQVLALNEFLELIVPICYLFCFLIAFYGPNAHLLGQNIPFPKFLDALASLAFKLSLSE